jgi:hypothetical protein
MTAPPCAGLDIAPQPGDCLLLGPEDYRFEHPHDGPILLEITGRVALADVDDTYWWVVHGVQTTSGQLAVPRGPMRVRATAYPDSLLYRPSWPCCSQGASTNVAAARGADIAREETRR